MDSERPERGAEEAQRDAGGEDRRAAWIRVVQPEEADGELAETYRRLGARRRIAHVVGLHSLHPPAMEDHIRLYRTVMFGPSPLARLEREAMAVVVSSVNECFY